MAQTKLLMVLSINYLVRNLMGEDLGPLNSKELESLERQLDSSLKQIRSTRVLNFWISLKIDISLSISIIFNWVKAVLFERVYIYICVYFILWVWFLYRPNSCWISSLIYNVRYENNLIAFFCISYSGNTCIN